MGRRNMRRFAAAVTTVAVLVSMTGCRTYDEFEVREPYGGRVAVRQLAGGGRFVVVQATGAGQTVPGAGWWRVDRETGDTVALPGAVSRISADGERVLLNDGRLWVDGQISSAIDGVYSPDLRAKLSEETGVLTATVLATGASVDVEAAYPRPADVFSVGSQAISDDGQSVQYRMTGTAKTTRIARFGSPAVDIPVLVVGNNELPDVYLLSADGSTIARKTALVTRTRYEDTEFFLIDEVLAKFDLIDVRTGDVITSKTWEKSEGVSGETTFDLRAIARNGRRIWVTQTASVIARGFCAPGATPNTCPTDSKVRTLHSNGDEQVVDLRTSGYGWFVFSFDATADASFATVSYGFVGLDQIQDPIVIHSTRGTVDHLEQTSTGSRTVRATMMSDDGRLIVANSGGSGWYEYSDPPEPPA